MAYKATSNIKHNGHSYEPGDTLKDITREQADRLIKLGAAVEESAKNKKE